MSIKEQQIIITCSLLEVKFLNEKLTTDDER